MSKVPLGLFVLSVLMPQLYSFYVLPALRKQLLLHSHRDSEDFYTCMKLNPKELHLNNVEERLGNAARLAAWKAGEVVKEGLGNIDLADDVESKIGSRDIVTKVDKASQEIIRDTILSIFPDHKFLGEEDVPPGIEESAKALEKFKNEPHLWIVDPVDGTTNFAHGMPLCVIVIAYASYGVVKHGFIYDPFRDESFVAWKDKGAYMNGRKLRCSKSDRLDSAVVCTGSPPNIESLEACLRATNLLSSQVRSMRILGSAAVHLSWTAAGRIDAFFETDLNAWDVAAGALIIQEAGGRVTDVWGKEYELATRNTVVSNGKIHDELLVHLQKAKMWMNK